MVPRVPWTRKNIYFVESVCRIFCVCLVQDTALSKSIYFIALIYGLLRSFRSVFVSPCFRKTSGLLATGYGLYIKEL